MSREIKFRAWDKNTKKMSKPFNIYAFNAYDGEYVDNSYFSTEKNEENSEAEYFEVADENIMHELEIMQYTGLKDKNGKEIYEDDVLLCHGKSGDVTDRVIFDKGKFTTNKGWVLDWSNEHYEVIGNVYESPELLKESHE